MVFKMVVDFENEARRLYSTSILNRAFRWLDGRLKDYRIEKDVDYDNNPAILTVRLWYWKHGLDPVENEIRAHRAREDIYRAIKYVIGYLKDYKIEKDQKLKQEPFELVIKVWWRKEEPPREIV